jgi:hypothetical protein
MSSSTAIGVGTATSSVTLTSKKASSADSNISPAMR